MRAPPRTPRARSPRRSRERPCSSPLARGRDADDAISASGAGRHEERTIGRRCHGAEAAVFLIQKDFTLRRAIVIDGEPPEVLLLERRDDERVIPRTPVRTREERRAPDRERRCAGAPDRIDEPAARAIRSERCRPAEVRACRDLVDLVLHLVAGVDDEAGAGPWIEGESTRIPESQGVDRGWRRLAFEGGVVARD